MKFHYRLVHVQLINKNVVINCWQCLEGLKDVLVGFLATHLVGWLCHG